MKKKIEIATMIDDELYDNYEEVIINYKEILLEAFEVFINKIGLNGDKSYKKNEFKKDIMLVWAKAQRKFERAEYITHNYDNLIELDNLNRKEILNYLRDAYFDGINYNIMATILIDKYIYTEEVKNE